MSEPSKEALEAAKEWLFDACPLRERDGGIDWIGEQAAPLAKLLDEWRQRGRVTGTVFEDLAMMLRLIAQGRTYTPEEITDFLKRHGCTGNPLRYKPPN